MAEILPRLRQGVPIGQLANGTEVFPHPKFILFWQQFCDLLEQLPDIQALADQAQASADAAQASADAAQAAADQSTSETSIVNSYPTNPTVPPLISADNTGSVTISTHDRVYGDPTLNPTVSVTGGLIATGGSNPDVIRVYYSDPARAGGAVTYQFTVDPADPPVQGGSIHVVGAVTIPAAGTQSGNGVRPPGYVEP